LEQAIFPVGTRPPMPHQSYAHISKVVEVPNLIDLQLAAFQWLQEYGIKQLLEEFSPIKDFTGNRLELSFVDYEFREPHLSEQECTQRDQTYSITLYVKARLLVKGTGEIKEPFDLFFGDMPMMTAQGTFITSGTERVIVSQLLRSPAEVPGWTSRPALVMSSPLRSTVSAKYPSRRCYAQSASPQTMNCFPCSPEKTTLPTINLLSPRWTVIRPSAMKMLH
jgi:DNA-directed RNA polymerase beta subunit